VFKLTRRVCGRRRYLFGNEVDGHHHVVGGDDGEPEPTIAFD